MASVAYAPSLAGDVPAPAPALAGAAPSREIPNDFRSSIAAWWSSSGYRDARTAEDRLLRRLSYYSPAPPEPSKSWFNWSGSAVTDTTAPRFVPPVDPKTGFAATVRNVFIPTPDPALAPLRPDEPGPAATASASASIASSDSRPASPSKLGHAAPKAKSHCHSRTKQDYINTLEISKPELNGSKEAVVVLHGYAAAQGFYFRNWDSIAHSAASTGRRTFFLDWLGMGLSSRPNPALLAAPPTAPVEQRVARAEHFFLSSLEAWREAEGVERMVLVGHSLGGYLATAYSLRYPERVSSLVLVSPVGIPAGQLQIPGSGAKAPPPSTREAASAQAAQNAVDQEEATAMAAAGAQGEAKQWEEERRDSSFRRGMTKFFLWGWDRGLSPFSILRGIGPWGPLLVGRYSSRRFATQTPEDIRDLHAYIYGTTVLKGSGEFCISHILAPGAYARLPLVERMHKLKMPVTLMYGDNDWMDVDGGRDAVKVLEKAGNHAASCHVVPNAGHHLYLDNSEVTNGLISKAIRTAPKVAA